MAFRTGVRLPSPPLLHACEYGSFPVLLSPVTSGVTKYWRMKVDRGHASSLHCHKELKERHQTYCSYICQNEHKHSEYIRKWKKGEVSGIVGEYGISSHIRQYLFQKYGSKCSRCGWHEVNPYTGKIPLEIEHIDGNYMNNSESNLDLICPNCHSLTSTYKVLNCGRGRKARKKYA